MFRVQCLNLDLRGHFIGQASSLILVQFVNPFPSFVARDPKVS